MRNTRMIFLLMMVLGLMLACSLPGAIKTIPDVETIDSIQATSNSIEVSNRLTDSARTAAPVETPVPAAVEESSPNITASRYTILPGDTLEDVAQAFGVSVDAICELNGLSAGEPVVEGMQILIPLPPGDQVSSAASDCHQAIFTTDVTFPDGAHLSPGQRFTKVWRVKNNSACTWANLDLQFEAGTQMGGAAQHPVALQPVTPNQEADIAIELTAPLAPGEYRGVWRLYHQGSPLNIGLTILIRVDEITQALPSSVTPLQGNPTATPLHGGYPTNTRVSATSSQATATPVKINPALQFSYQPYSLLELAGGGEWAHMQLTYTRLHIINNASRSLCKLWIYPSNSSNMGSNYLSTPLETYRQIALIIPEGADGLQGGLYNLQVEACPDASGPAWGSGLFGMTLVMKDLGEGDEAFPAWIIYNQDSVLKYLPGEFFTRSGATRFWVTSTWGEICTIQMWPSYKKDWQQGDPLFYDRDNPVGNKQSHVFEITPGAYNMAAWNCSGEFLDKASNIDIFNFNTWEVEWQQGQVRQDTSRLGEELPCSRCNGLSQASLETWDDVAVDTVTVPLPLNTTHADVLPLCLITHYNTQTQVDVGWRCGWAAVSDGYEFTLQRLHGDPFTKACSNSDGTGLFTCSIDGATISAKALVLDKRYFEVLEVQPFKVLDEEEQVIHLGYYPNASVLRTVNIYETNGAQRFGFQINPLDEGGFLVDVMEGNRESYIQGAIVVIRAKEKLAAITQDFIRYRNYPEENVYLESLCGTFTEDYYDCNSGSEFSACFLEVYAYMPEGDDDFSIGICHGWCISEEKPRGNESSFALLNKMILRVK